MKIVMKCLIFILLEIYLQNELKKNLKAYSK